MRMTAIGSVLVVALGLTGCAAPRRPVQAAQPAVIPGPDQPPAPLRSGTMLLPGPY